MVTRKLLTELRRYAIKRWVPCGDMDRKDMDRRLKISQSAKVECGFRILPRNMIAVKSAFSIGPQYNAIQCNATMQCSAVQCSAVQCNAMQCNACMPQVRRKLPQRKDSISYQNDTVTVAYYSYAMQCNAMQCNAMQYMHIM